MVSENQSAGPSRLQQSMKKRAALTPANRANPHAASKLKAPSHSKSWKAPSTSKSTAKSTTKSTASKNHPMSKRTGASKGTSKKTKSSSSRPHIRLSYSEAMKQNASLKSQVSELQNREAQLTETVETSRVQIVGLEETVKALTDSVQAKSDRIAMLERLLESRGVDVVTGEANDVAERKKIDEIVSKNAAVERQMGAQEAQLRDTMTTLVEIETAFRQGMDPIGDEDDAVEVQDCEADQEVVAAECESNFEYDSAVDSTQALVQAEPTEVEATQVEATEM